MNMPPLGEVAASSLAPHLRWRGRHASALCSDQSLRWRQREAIRSARLHSYLATVRGSASHSLRSELLRSEALIDSLHSSHVCERERVSLVESAALSLQ
jgi:hypothetical protein